MQYLFGYVPSNGRLEAIYSMQEQQMQPFQETLSAELLCLNTVPSVPGPQLVSTCDGVTVRRILVKDETDTVICPFAAFQHHSNKEKGFCFFHGPVCIYLASSSVHVRFVPAVSGMLDVGWGC